MPLPFSKRVRYIALNLGTALFYGIFLGIKNTKNIESHLMRSSKTVISKFRHGEGILLNQMGLDSNCMNSAFCSSGDQLIHHKCTL